MQSVSNKLKQKNNKPDRDNLANNINQIPIISSIIIPSSRITWKEIMQVFKIMLPKKIDRKQMLPNNQNQSSKYQINQNKSILLSQMRIKEAITKTSGKLQ